MPPPGDSRGVPPPHGPRIDFWNNDIPSYLVPLGPLFGDERHWIGKQSRRHRKHDRCAGCLALLPIQWAGYVAAVRLHKDEAGNIRETPVCWNIPEGNADDFEGDIRGVTFHSRLAPPSSARRILVRRVDRPIRTDIPPAFSIDAYLDRRERLAKPIQPVCEPDELTHEAIKRYLDAERSLAAVVGQPTLPGFESPVPPPSAGPVLPPEESRKKMREMIDRLDDGFDPGGAQ